MNKKVFVVIVTYNGAKWIDKNIGSLLHSSYPVSIIVVDNNSTDDSVTLLEKYPEIGLIKSAENLGFGKANTIGMKKALEQEADYVFLLNQDAWVFENTIAGLVKKMEAMPQFGIMSPMHYSGDGVTFDKSFETYYKRSTVHDKNVASIPFVNAAAWMLSKKCIETVGYFEPLFGHYGEDRNYCDRVRYHRFSIGIDTDSKIVHDRVITRSFNKDLTQGKYKILATLIDPNRSLLSAYVQGLKEALGLPKYFSTFYSKQEVQSMLKTLFNYYMAFALKPKPVLTARKSARHHG